MLALRGAVWSGYGDEVMEDHVVLVDDNGYIAAIAPYHADLVADAEVIGSAGCWVVPGVYDRHVHLADLQPQQLLAGGVVAVRDLGEPEGRPGTKHVADSGLPVHSVGQVLTTVDAWSDPERPSGEIPAAIDSAEEAVAHTAARHERGAEAIKIGLHGNRSRASTPPAVLAATVGAAHERSLPVIARAQTVEMVVRALEAGVDELANMPAEELPSSLVRDLRTAGVSVCSTMQMLFAAGLGHDAARNASALVAAGVPISYGTDLGNVAARPGVDPRELERLAQAGLGRIGALRAASFGPVEVGMPARAVVLQDSPVDEPAAWWAPLVTISGTQRASGIGRPPAVSAK